jgi:anti-anti-sigma regulatory factor
MGLKVDIRKVPGHTDAALVVPIGELTAKAVPKLIDVLSQTLADGKPKLILCPVEMTVDDEETLTTVLAKLVGVGTAAQEAGGGLALIDLEPQIAQLIQIMGLDIFLYPAEGPDEALAAIAAGPPKPKKAGKNDRPPQRKSAPDLNAVLDGKAKLDLKSLEWWKKHPVGELMLRPGKLVGALRNETMAKLTLSSGKLVVWDPLMCPDWKPLDLEIEPGSY